MSYDLIFATSYRGAHKSLARPTSQCILFDGENISFDASLVICINSTTIPPIIIITVCPTRYRTRHFFNNFTTNEDIVAPCRNN